MTILGRGGIKIQPEVAAVGPRIFAADQLTCLRHFLPDDVARGIPPLIRADVFRQLVANAGQLGMVTRQRIVWMRAIALGGQGRSGRFRIGIQQHL